MISHVSIEVLILELVVSSESKHQLAFDNMPFLNIWYTRRSFVNTRLTRIIKLLLGQVTKNNGTLRKYFKKPIATVYFSLLADNQNLKLSMIINLT